MNSYNKVFNSFKINLLVFILLARNTFAQESIQEKIEAILKDKIELAKTILKNSQITDKQQRQQQNSIVIIKGLQASGSISSAIDLIGIVGRIENVSVLKQNDDSLFLIVTFTDSRPAELSILLLNGTVINNKAITLEIYNEKTIKAANSITTTKINDNKIKLQPQHEKDIQHSASYIVASACMKGYQIPKESLEKAEIFDHENELLYYINAKSNKVYKTACSTFNVAAKHLTELISPEDQKEHKTSL